MARTLTARYYKTRSSNILEHWDDGYATTGILEIMDDSDEREGTSGDGHNLAAGEDIDISRPLTTDPWDNALMLKYERGYQDSASDK